MLRILRLLTFLKKAHCYSFIWIGFERIANKVYAVFRTPIFLEVCPNTLRYIQSSCIIEVPNPLILAVVAIFPILIHSYRPSLNLDSTLFNSLLIEEGIAAALLL